ncbi:bifunctional diaminohydroxyphosphoribosylaminopyrimidine deaminase/5-amino-6-(5-phosphoribosylamino)uracil reductase RibD [Chitinophaga rhizophila]|uniref:Riboflavin biosynthesis protein RibD n=1 Tax=Chitinophaga rhizophila TaxID=2866212 RepID=A0ABS7G9G9_9BACT|nr:bifunctional diaminohydroxyphosphoribosylaminopyrimidine deaminase/5-amino-6-(5-phosphoribosylamino)uracil reductase RibD [Chitinophaga rhizophila]MBW8683780.1 bifunctional diaminohydroxyphosphoribosylaminopyrimidine deaminase/5-amino-6-(5-phosphoribosylamino)uracil reductase RibD [Chitinophaga rhizophila]
MDSSIDEFYMQRCIQLARLGAGNVAPNPMVGAVLVYQGRIIGEGYHRQYGYAHAEVNCIQAVKPGDRHLIPAATIYVSLEPCAHYGKTPPCAELIVAEKIGEVVIGCVDTFSKVAGKGIEILKNAGITVRTGILEAACRELNSRFFTFHEQQRPYIILKWAQNTDGYMAGADGRPVRISDTLTDRLVHRWRSEEMGILVGANTAIADNPRLNNRHWTGKDPLRIVIDRALQTPRAYHLWNGPSATLFITASSAEKTSVAEAITADFSQPLLPQLMKILHGRNILSVLVEGGAYVLEHLIAAGLWDEARIIFGNNPLAQGVKAPTLPQHLLMKEISIKGDKILYYRNSREALTI